MDSRRHRDGAGYTVALAVLLATVSAHAGDRDDEIRKLREELRKTQQRIERLEARDPAGQPPSADDPDADLDAALEALPEEAPSPAAAAPAIASRRFGGAHVRLLDLSLDVLAAVGGSTEDDETLQDLQAGDHDPRKNGFTLQAVELSGMGAVDPYLTGEAHVLFFLDPENSETVVELEEAFFTTQSLPFGLQVEGGHFLTEFGRLQPRHPHAWHWQDQPVILSRLFGADGQRNPGVRLGWLLPLPWFSELHVGVQNATGETMPSFLGGSLEHEHDEDEHDEIGELPVETGDHEGEGDHQEAAFEEGIAGRPIVDQTVDDPGDVVVLSRWTGSVDLTDTVSTQAGVSFLTGPNVTGRNARTHIYGADVVLKWRPKNNFRGWPFLVFESEIAWRDYEAEAFADPDDPDLLFPNDDLEDWGLYAQALYGFRYGWATGMRVEYATGSGESVEGRANDPFRDDRFRLSPLLVWQPTEFSRFRLQYNYDDADHLDDGDAHAVWFGVEFLYGSHPAHTY